MTATGNQTVIGSVCSRSSVTLWRRWICGDPNDYDRECCQVVDLWTRRPSRALCGKSRKDQSTALTLSLWLACCHEGTGSSKGSHGSARLADEEEAIFRGVQKEQFDASLQRGGQGRREKADESAWASGHGPELPAAGYPWGHPLQPAKAWRLQREVMPAAEKDVAIEICRHRARVWAQAQWRCPRCWSDATRCWR